MRSAKGEEVRHSPSRPGHVLTLLDAKAMMALRQQHHEQEFPTKHLFHEAMILSNDDLCHN